MAARRARRELKECKQAVQTGLERLGLKVRKLTAEEAAVLLGKCYGPGRPLPNPYDDLNLVVGSKDPFSEP